MSVFRAMGRLVPWLERLFADGAHAGAKPRSASKPLGRWPMEILERCDRATGFEVTPERRVVERTLAWMSLNRRVSEDFEAHTEFAVTRLYVAMIEPMTRRIARD